MMIPHKTAVFLGLCAACLMGASMALLLLDEALVLAYLLMVVGVFIAAAVVSSVDPEDLV